MTPRLFVLEIDGERIYAAAWPSAAERQQALARGPAAALDSAPAELDEFDCRPRGRPSFDQAIAAAVDELAADLQKITTTAGRARAVLHRIATVTSDPGAIPSRDTVERWLRQNPLQKCQQKLRTPKIA